MCKENWFFSNKNQDSNEESLDLENAVYELYRDDDAQNVRY